MNSLPRWGARSATTKSFCLPYAPRPGDPGREPPRNTSSASTGPRSGNAACLRRASRDAACAPAATWSQPTIRAASPRASCSPRPAARSTPRQRQSVGAMLVSPSSVPRVGDCSRRHTRHTSTPRARQKNESQAQSGHMNPSDQRNRTSHSAARRSLGKNARNSCAVLGECRPALADAATPQVIGRSGTVHRGPAQETASRRSRRRPASERTPAGARGDGR